jgi:hypothetical protein
MKAEGKIPNLRYHLPETDLWDIAARGLKLNMETPDQVSVVDILSITTTSTSARVNSSFRPTVLQRAKSAGTTPTFWTNVNVPAVGILKLQPGHRT